MHPRVFLDGFWRNDLTDEVFVAMSFDPRYDARWTQIFKPAIESCPFGETRLRAIRVDIRKSGDSILTDIINGIAHSQLVLADISVTDRWQVDGNTCSCRNGNVMYEVGLAFACRQPTEVVLVRDDSERLLFDVSHIPVLHFNADRSTESVELVRRALDDRLRERDLLKDLRVKQILESLSQFEIGLIRQNSHLEVLGWDGPSYPAGVAMALPSLLQKRILRLFKLGTAEHPDAYSWTTLGRIVSQFLSAQMPR